MKKHGMKILIGFYAVVIAATVWLCLSVMGNVRQLANGVETEASVLETNLKDTSRVANLQSDFHSGRVLNRIHSNWSRASEVPERTLPTTVLHSPSGE
jgi:hypothetical protein